MLSWQIDLVGQVETGRDTDGVFAVIEGAARALGFDYCAYGLRVPVPVSNPRTFLISNYPESWKRRYLEAGYLRIDPTVQHGRQSRRAVTWSDRLFSATPHLLHEARSAGLRYGWARSSLDAYGAVGMLTLARGQDPISADELAAVEDRLTWLAQLAHVCLADKIRARQRKEQGPALSARETEVLKWTADGKSSQDIADILALSKATVDFHVRNAVLKLGVANKTSAVVRAVQLGFLH